MRILVCSACGLSYGRSTLTQYLMSACGASCPRCSAPLVDASAADAGASNRLPRLKDGSPPERPRAAVERTLR